MTTPNLWQDFGLASQTGQQEFNAFNSIRDQMLQGLMGRAYAYRTQYQQPAANAYGVPTVPAQPPPQGLTQPQTQTLATQQAPMTDDALLGAAKFWGIPEDVASQMPRDQLTGIIQQNRQNAQPAESSMLQRMADEPWMLGSMALSAATGAGEAMTGLVQHLPVLGEAISRIHAVHAADQWLHSVDEGLRASNPASFSGGVFGGGQSPTGGALGLGGDVGGFAALSAPIAGTWAIAGKIAGGSALWSEAYGATWGPIARAAGMASATSFMLGGRWATQPWTEAIRTAMQTGDWSRVPADAIDYMKNHYQEFMQGATEANAALVMGAGSEAALQHFGPQLQALSRRVFGRIGPQGPAVPTAPPMQPPLGDMEIPVPGLNARPNPDDVLSVAPPSQMDLLRASAANGNQQAQTMLDYMGGPGDMAISLASPTPLGPAVPGSMQSETIRSAAYKVNATGKIYTGQTHVTITPDLLRDHPDITQGEVTDGFVTSAGRFVDRAEAERVAQASGQAPSGTSHGATFHVGDIPGGLDEEGAAAHAAQINRAVQATSGPALPQVAAATSPDDLTIAAASMTNNPGGINVVQGVAEPAKLIEQLGANVQFVQHGTRLDALISDEPITQQAVDEYHQHGFFTGQSALLPNGVEGQITGIQPGIVSVRPTFGGAEFYVKPEDIMPRLNTAHSAGGEPLWNSFNDYANQRAAATADAMGGTLTPDQLLTVRTQNTPTYMRDWFQTNGINDLSDQARIRSFFNVKYVDSMKMLAPQEFAESEAVQSAANQVEPAPQTPLGRLDKLAGSKGFVVVPQGETGGFTVQEANVQSPYSVSFGSREAAEEWIKTVDPQRPDITPQTVVPAELISAPIPTEPLQDTSLNPHQFDSGVKAINETLQPAPSQSQPAGMYAQMYGDRAALLKATGKLETMQNEYTKGAANLSFISTMFRELDSGLRGAGLDLGIEDARQRVLMASDQMHNYESPFLQELAGINAQVRPSLHESGDYFRVYQIQDPAARLAEAQRVGMTPAEVQTFDQRADVYRRMFADNPTLAADPQREIANYMSWVTKRQSGQLGSSPQSWDEFAGLTGVTQPFFEYARGSDMNIAMREVDPRILDRMYVRSLAWKKFMDPVYPDFATKFRDIGQQVSELQPFTDVIGNWMKVVKYGYRAEQDRGADIIHWIAQMAMGKEVTQEQAMHMFGGLMNNTYNSLLGFQPHILARDGLRLLFALPKVGSDLGQVMAEYASSGEARQQMWDFAYKNGISRTAPPMLERPFPFAEEPVQYAADPSAQADPQGWRMRALQSVTRTVGDVMPAWFRDPTPTRLSPMYWVGKQAETMRMWVGNAMYRRTSGALDAFLQSDRGPAAVDQLLGDSGVRTMKDATKDTFMQYVASGDREAAAIYAARQMTDDTMFRYGSLETPIAMRSTFGRLAMQMGNFAEHVWGYVHDGLTQGNVTDRVKFAASAGAVFAGLGAMSESTGWNFNKMNPFLGMGFTGGPWLEPMLNVEQGISAAIHQIGNDPQQRDATDFNAAGSALSDVATMMNPVGGLMRSGERVYNAMQSSQPGQALARAFITGEPGIYQDWANAQLQQSQQMMQNMTQMAQPHPTPMSVTRPSVPNVPPMMPVYPPGMPAGGGSFPSGAQPSPLQVPMPGGQPYAYRPNPASYPGVTDPSRVYSKNGQLVYDTPDTVQGHVPTHALAMAGQVLLPGETWEQAERRVTAQHYASPPPVVNDVNALDPDTRNRVFGLMQLAQQQGVHLAVGETARSQARQNYLFAQGRSPEYPGTPVTWTLTSDHGRGRAVDFVVNGDPTGSNPGYQWLQKAAPQFGLVPMGSIDPGHVSLTDSSRAATPYSPQAAYANTGPHGAQF